MRITLWLVLGVLSICNAANQSLAAPVLFEGHYYQFIQVDDPFSGNNNSWATAEAAASASTLYGINGYLATITSATENAFLLSLVSGQFSQFTGAWIGGKSPEGWLTGGDAGNAFTYTNWGGVEPNNSGYAYMNIGTSFAGIAPGQWADDSGVQGVPSVNDPVVGYFVEHDVPEPASLLLFCGGWMIACRRNALWVRR